MFGAIGVFQSAATSAPGGVNAMNDVDAKQIGPDDIDSLTKAARLDLGAGRPEVVAPALDGMLQLMDLLDDVDVGETPPTNSFNATWRDLP